MIFGLQGSKGLKHQSLGGTHAPPSPCHLCSVTSTSQVCGLLAMHGTDYRAAYRFYTQPVLLLDELQCAWFTFLESYAMCHKP